MNLKESARELSEKFQEMILATLRDGPLSAVEIAVQIGHSVPSISQYLRVLERVELVCRVKYVHRAGHGSYRIWGINKSKFPKQPAVKKEESGITKADLEWLNYWRLPRAERRRLRAESTNADNANEGR